MLEFNFSLPALGPEEKHNPQFVKSVWYQVPHNFSLFLWRVHMIHLCSEENQFKSLNIEHGQ